MNSLTKVLLEDLLEVENKKVTAIYGGGFKPPTKGHYNVVEKAAEQNPEIDDIIIYVGGGERDGISQGESIQIWELYKKYLPLKTRIEPSKAPIGDILRYAKEHPEEEVLWIIGARENNPEDFADIASRTRTIDKYPNLQLRVIQTAGGVSGTAARKAVRDNNKEQFFHLIPDIEEKEQVWDIVSPIVKEGIINNTKAKLKKFISAVKQENKETKEAAMLVIKAAKGEIDLTDEQKKQIGDQLKDVLKLVGLTAIATLPGGFIAGALIKIFKAEHLITPSSMVTELVTDTEIICDNCGWEWEIADGGDDLYICHKCGHDNNPDLNEASDPQAGTALPYGSGFAPVEENDPFGIKAYARELVNEALKDTWKPEETFVSLSKFMIDNGMNIQPLPKVKIISNDDENASNLLGKTAYYNPNDKSITLYTKDRHPKDISRSFTHEMVHHEQNLDGRLNNINTTNTNEDGALPEIEKEAYEKGNMMFRNWEDSIKNV
jgi:hypothetical protein